MIPTPKQKCKPLRLAASRGDLQRRRDLRDSLVEMLQRRFHVSTLGGVRQRSFAHPAQRVGQRCEAALDLGQLILFSV